MPHANLKSVRRAERLMGTNLGWRNPRVAVLRQLAIPWKDAQKLRQHRSRLALRLPPPHAGMGGAHAMLQRRGIPALLMGRVSFLHVIWGVLVPSKRRCDLDTRRHPEDSCDVQQRRPRDDPEVVSGPEVGKYTSLGDPLGFVL